MALFAGAELRPGDQVAVEFTPPFSTPPIRVDAKICNRSGYHYGVEFLAVDNAQRENVAQLGLHLASFAFVG
jgi:PilZ domain